MLNHVLNCFFIIAHSKNILNWKNANLLWYPFKDSLTYLHLPLFHMIPRHQLKFCKIYKFIRPKWFDNLFELYYYTDEYIIYYILYLIMKITTIRYNRKFVAFNRLKLLPLNHITLNSFTFAQPLLDYAFIERDGRFIPGLL